MGRKHVRPLCSIAQGPPSLNICSPWQSESGTALVAIQWKRWRRLVTTVATIEVPMADHNDSDLFDVSGES